MIVATALTACGIETYDDYVLGVEVSLVATALTACGIETIEASYISSLCISCNGAYRLRY